jgi:hypothetical protein
MRKLFIASALLMAAGSTPLFACDLCALYTSLAARELRPGWSAGLFEQYTDFATVQEDGDEVDDPADQRLRSSITQLFVGYQWSRRFGVQVNMPWLDRSFDRAAGHDVESGSESGLGDVALLAHWLAVERVVGTRTFRLSLLGGVKLPTGDADRLAEELDEEHHEELAAAAPGPVTASPLPHDGEEHGIASAVHGHDLALGTGSTDFVLGLALAATAGRGFLEANAQYALRRTGDFDYRFADDLQATLAGGAYLLLRHEHTLALGAQLAGEHKGEDRLAGESLEDTSIESLFAGPFVRFTGSDRWFAELAVDLPLSIDNGAVQIVPDWRARLGVTHRF